MTFTLHYFCIVFNINISIKTSNNVYLTVIKYCLQLFPNIIKNINSYLLHTFQLFIHPTCIETYVDTSIVLY